MDTYKVTEDILQKISALRWAGYHFEEICHLLGITKLVYDEILLDKKNTE